MSLTCSCYLIVCLKKSLVEIPSGLNVSQLPKNLTFPSQDNTSPRPPSRGPKEGGSRPGSPKKQLKSREGTPKKSLRWSWSLFFDLCWILTFDLSDLAPLRLRRRERPRSRQRMREARKLVSRWSLISAFLVYTRFCQLLVAFRTSCIRIKMIFDL